MVAALATTLLKGITPFKVQFKRDPLKWQKLVTLPKIRANKRTPFISYMLDNKEEETKEESKDALFVKEDKQEEKVREGFILFKLS